MSISKLIMRLSVGAFLVYLLLFKHEVSFAEVKSHIAGLPLGYLLVALGLYLAGQMISAYRWSGLSTMGGRPASFHDTWPVYFTGMFFNMCLPTSIGGDVWRVVGLSRKTGSKSGAFASVFMDRNIGLAALLVMGLISSVVAPKLCTIEATFFKTPGAGPDSGRIVLPLWPIFLLLLAGYIAANAAIFSDSFCRMAGYASNRLRLGFIGARIEKLHNSVQAFRQPLSAHVPALLLSVVYQVSEIGVVITIACGMGLNASPFVFATIVTFQAVACLLPITFNGVGVREAIFCAVLKGQMGEGVKDEALAISLAYFAVVLMSSLIGGVVYLLSGLERPSASEAGAEAVVNTVVSGQ